VTLQEYIFFFVKYLTFNLCKKDFIVGYAELKLIILLFDPAFIEAPCSTGDINNSMDNIN